MRKTKFYFLFFLINCLCLASCQQSEQVPTVANRTDTLPKEAQLYLDSIKSLVQAEKWYAAHTAITKFKVAFPQSNYYKEIDILNQKIRHSFNAQPEKVTGNNLEDNRIGQSFQNLRKDRNELKQRTFYHALSATPYLNEDAVQAYIAVPFDSSQAPNLHFTVQNLSVINYQIQYVQFEIDGLTYPYLPKETYSDNGSNYYWQWFDDEVETAQDLELLQQLSQAQEARIIFYFQQNYKKIRLLSAEEKKGLLNILKAFKSIE